MGLRPTSNHEKPLWRRPSGLPPDFGPARSFISVPAFTTDRLVGFLHSLSARRWSFCLIDHKELNTSTGWFQFQSQPFQDRRENRRSVGPRRQSHIWIWRRDQFRRRGSLKSSFFRPPELSPMNLKKSAARAFPRPSKLRKKRSQPQPFSKFPAGHRFYEPIERRIVSKILASPGIAQSSRTAAAGRGMCGVVIRNGGPSRS